MKIYRHKIITGIVGTVLILQPSLQAQSLEITAALSRQSENTVTLSTAVSHESLISEAVTNHTLDSEKIKRINKSFKVKTTDELSIENKFGKVHINTWDKNEITVDIEIIARASTDSRAQQVLDLIDVQVNESSNLISFRTQIDDMHNKNWGNNNKGFEINYTVSMPKRNPLTLKNSYGDVYLADLIGNADISVSYGNLKAGRLSGNNTVKLAYGSGRHSIAQMKEGSLNVSYSKLTLEETQNLELKNSYSDVDISQAGDIDLSTKYGAVAIKSINNLSGTSGYTDFKIGNLNNKIDMKFQYCSGFEIEQISPKFQSINLEGGYSSFNLNFARNADFDFDVNVHYGDLRVDQDLVKFNVVEKKQSSSTYQGKFGKGSHQASVTVSSRYGDVRFAQKD